MRTGKASTSGYHPAQWGPQNACQRGWGGLHAAWLWSIAGWLQDCELAWESMSPLRQQSACGAFQWHIDASYSAYLVLSSLNRYLVVLTLYIIHIYVFCVYVNTQNGPKSIFTAWPHVSGCTCNALMKYRRRTETFSKWMIYFHFLKRSLKRGNVWALQSEFLYSNLGSALDTRCGLGQVTQPRLLYFYQ